MRNRKQIRKFSVPDELRSEVKRILRLHGGTEQAADKIIRHVEANWFPQMSTDKLNYERVSPDRIIEVVCQHFLIDLAEMQIRTREPHIAYPRQVLCYFLTTHGHLGLKATGNIVHQDHTTVMNSRDRIMGKMRKHARMQSDVTTIRAALLAVNKMPVTTLTRQLEAV